jgi:sterol desaturase/sphingolipid hydroxylase (fatty acid hydroxylase superfamily)
LHGIWDGLLGTAENPHVQWQYGAKIEDEFPRASLQELAEHSTPREWSRESRALAIKRAT